MRKLVIVDDEGRKTTVPLVRSEITIGRQEGNTIRLTERNVSRTHARIYREEDRYFVEDKSRYGTKKNGRKLLEITPFDQGDVIIIGTYCLQLQSEATAIDDAAPTHPLSDAEAGEREPVTPSAFATLDEPSRAFATTTTASVSARVQQVRGRLICMTEPFVGSEFEFAGDSLSIGTDASCDLIIEHESIAPRHARFSDEDGYRISPIDAGYPVAVNGKYRPTAALKSGDEVLLGELKFRYCLPGEAFSLVGLDEIEDDLGVSARPAWLLPAIGIASLVLVVALIAVVSGGDGADTETGPDTEPEETEVAVLENPHGDALSRAQSHMNNARWAEAINELESIPEDADEHERATSMVGRAENELFNAETYEGAMRSFDEGDYHATLRALADIPAGTYYRTRAEDENLERRAIDAVVDQRLAASRVAEEDGDLDEARSLIVEIQAIAPANTALAARLTQLDSIRDGSNRRPSRDERPERVPEPEPERERTPEPEPERERDPEPEPSEPEPEPEPEVDDREARRNQASELRQAAARAGVQQNFQEAIRLLEEARELNPGDAQINLMLFSNYRQVGNRSRAARAIRRYLRQRPNDPRRAEYEEWLEENAPD